MPKLRLNNEHRQKLRRLAKRLVTAPQERVEAVNRAHQEAAALVREYLVAKFPQDDMELLEKYKVAAKDYCIKFVWGEKWRMFNFNKEYDDVPLIPLAAHTYNVKPYPSTPEIDRALNALEREGQALERASEEVLRPYLSLIEYQARTFEDVVEAWPEAEQIRAELEPKKLPVPITALKEKIAADMQRRKAA